MKTTANTTATTATTAPKATATKRPKAVPVNPDNAGWRFAPTAITLDGFTFACSYSVSRKSGDVYAFAKIGGTSCRIHIGTGNPLYHAAFEAAMANAAAEQPKAEPKAATPAAKQPKAEAKPATPVKAAKQPKAKAETAAPAAKQPKPVAPVKAAKQPEAAPKAEPAKQVEPAGKGWIGTSITGKGWAITFDQATQRTRVSFTGTPSAKQKAAVESAGFYFSAALKTWNKKLTCKAYRAAKELAATLTALK